MSSVLFVSHRCSTLRAHFLSLNLPNIWRTTIFYQSSAIFDQSSSFGSGQNPSAPIRATIRRFASSLKYQSGIRSLTQVEVGLPHTYKDTWSMYSLGRELLYDTHIAYVSKCSRRVAHSCQVMITLLTSARGHRVRYTSQTAHRSIEHECNIFFLEKIKFKKGTTWKATVSRKGHEVTGSNIDLGFPFLFV